MRKLGRHLTFAKVAACLALFIALGGVSYAAFKLPRNSVGAKQLRKGAVTPAKLSRASIRRLAGSTGPTGPSGPRGATGPQGARGETGAPGATHVVVREESAEVAKESFYVNRVFCNPGEVATGGGGGFTENAGKEVVEQSFPVTGTKDKPQAAGPGDTPTGWSVYLRNNSTMPRQGQWFVVCASP